MIDTFTVAVFGHRYINNPFSFERQLDLIIGELIKEKQYVEILVGRNGDFDQYVSSAVRRAKAKYCMDNTSLVLVLPHLTAEYQKNEVCFNEYYDEVEICQASSNTHFKAAIQIRNHDMVDRANLIICYIEHKYGGAYKTIQYALKKNKKIINLSEDNFPIHM